MSLTRGEVASIVNRVMSEYEMRLTIRQIYYRLVSPPYQLFPNVLQSYKNLVAMLVKARERGEVDWRRIEDRRRHISGEDRGFSSPRSFINAWMDAIRHLDKHYLRKRWSTQPKYIEVWVEKEALAALFERAAEAWRVVVYPTVGYSSLTMFMEAVERFKAVEKPITVLDFRDLDPSGMDMTRDVEERLTRYGAEIEVKRVALTIDQVERLHLASNPTKSADSRTPRYLEQFGDECWELDAYPPNELSTLIEESIRGEIDMDIWRKVESLQQEERQKLSEACESAEDSISEFEAMLRESF